MANFTLTFVALEIVPLHKWKEEGTTLDEGVGTDYSYVQPLQLFFYLYCCVGIQPVVPFAFCVAVLVSNQCCSPEEGGHDVTS